MTRQQWSTIHAALIAAGHTPAQILAAWQTVKAGGITRARPAAEVREAIERVLQSAPPAGKAERPRKTTKGTAP
jgi:hypothetical protein